MSICFLDSSALVKRYVTEAGSGWLQNLLSPDKHNPVIVARITWVEVLSALARRQREGTLAADDVEQAIQQFRGHMDLQYQVVELDQALMEIAGNLIARCPLRAYDAVQLAAAQQVALDLAQVQAPGLVFISADERLLAVAEAEGLQVDNPSRHS